MRLLLTILAASTIFASDVEQTTVDTGPLTTPIGEAVNAGGKTAGLIADYGMLVMVGALFLACGVCALWLVVRHFNRKTSTDYVPRDRVLQVAQELYPALVRKSPKELPDLRHHRLFPAATKVMRSAAGLSTTGVASDLLIRDLTVWTIRAYRDAMQDVLDDVYENPDMFNARAGDADSFRSRIDSAYTMIGAAVRCRLVDDFKFPAKVYDMWQAGREDADRVMIDVLDLVLEHPEPYWRLRGVLDSVYARCMMVRMNAAAFVKSLPPDVLAAVVYEPQDGVDATTMSGFSSGIGRGSGGYPAALFEKSRKFRA